MNNIHETIANWSQTLQSDLNASKIRLAANIADGVNNLVNSGTENKTVAYKMTPREFLEFVYNTASIHDNRVDIKSFKSEKYKYIQELFHDIPHDEYDARDKAEINLNASSHKIGLWIEHITYVHDFDYFVIVNSGYSSKSIVYISITLGENTCQN